MVWCTHEIEDCTRTWSTWRHFSSYLASGASGASAKSSRPKPPPDERLPERVPDQARADRTATTDSTGRHLYGARRHSLGLPQQASTKHYYTATHRDQTYTQNSAKTSEHAPTNHARQSIAQNPTRALATQRSAEADADADAALRSLACCTARAPHTHARALARFAFAPRRTPTTRTRDLPQNNSPSNR